MNKFLQSFSLSALIIVLSSPVANAYNSGSNHSYRNSGFKKKPVVTIGGYSDFKGAGMSQEEIYENDYLPNIAKTSTAQTTDGVVNNRNSDAVMANDTELHFQIYGISDLGMKYGAVVELEANATTDSQDNDINADKAYIFTESVIGKWEFGNNIGASQKMKVGAEHLARGAGGINGEYLNYISLPLIAHSDYYTYFTGTHININDPIEGYYSGTIDQYTKLPRFILVPEHPTGHGGYAKGYDNYLFECDFDGSGVVGNADTTYDTNDPEEVCAYERRNKQLLDLDEMQDATKVSYYTPRLWGVQLGASFTPNTNHLGASGRSYGREPSNIRNVLDWGVDYVNTFGNFGMALAVTGQQGSSDAYEYTTGGVALKTREDLDSLQYGASFTYLGLSVAGSYGKWGTSLYEKDTYSYQYAYNYESTQGLVATADTKTEYKKFDDATYYTGGLAYEFGSFAISGTYFKSNFQENEFEAYSIGADYEMAKGLRPYLEFTSFEFSSNQPVSSATNANQENEGIIKDNEGYVGLAGILLNF